MSRSAARPRRGWSDGLGPTTTVVWLRHGVTAHTLDKRFSGGLASANPGLIAEGRAQVSATAAWAADRFDRLDAIIASPVRRARESADLLADALLGTPNGSAAPTVVEDARFAEMEFGSWDGCTFAEVRERDQEGLTAWLGSLDAPAGGDGESIRAVRGRVLDGLASVVERYAGSTVAIVSHVTPIKVAVADCLDAPLESVYRMELRPASITVIDRYPDVGGTDRSSLRLFNAGPDVAW